MAANEALPLKVYYHLDQYLMHLIQNVSGRAPAEILNFFHELAGQVCEIGLHKKKEHQKAIRKNIIDYFPGTSIPFHMLVKGHKGRDYSAAKHGMESPDIFECRVEVGFPESRMYIKEEVLKDVAVQLMEKALLGGDMPAMPDFKKPEIRTPPMFKALMDSFAGRKKDDDGQG